MSSICGIFRRDRQAVAPGFIEAMTATLNNGYGEELGTWRNPGHTVALGHVKRVNTPESGAENLPFFHAASGLTITADARIDNREDLCHLLDIPPQLQPTIVDSQLILKAYQKWGRECVAHLLGDFAFVIWDEREKRLFCARDHLGQKPMFYYATKNWFIFASALKGLFTSKDVPRTLNGFWIADALTVLIADNEYTPYADIWRLPPAHWFSISPTDIKKERYWSLDPEKEIRLATEDDYVEAFREKLTAAVSCRVRSTFPIGAELSGGLDSSTVTAFAAQQTKAQGLKCITFSHVRGEENSSLEGVPPDEKEFQEILRGYAGIHHFHNLAAPGRGVLEALWKSLQVQDGPTHRVYGAFTDELYDTAVPEGARTMLSGFGGDEVVTHQAWEYLDELVCLRAWRNLWRECHLQQDNGQRINISSFLFKICGEYVPLLREVYHHLRHKPGDMGLAAFPVTPQFYKDANIGHRLATIPRMCGGGDVRNSQYHYITHTHVAARLEYSAIEAAAHGLEYRYPLLDIRLLEFHLALPASLKRKNGYGRYLFRRAIEGIVPPEIQWRVDKTRATMPSVRHRLLRDVHAIEDLIQRAKQTQAADYIDLEHLHKRFQMIVKPGRKPMPVRQGVFLNALKLLLFFEQNPTPLHFPNPISR